MRSCGYSAGRRVHASRAGNGVLHVRWLAPRDLVSAPGSSVFGASGAGCKKEDTMGGHVEFGLDPVLSDMGRLPVSFDVDDGILTVLDLVQSIEV